MSMFDTVYPDPARPIHCPGCSAVLEDFQTKDLGNYMNDYQEGHNARTYYGYKRVEPADKDSKFPSMEIDKNDRHVEPHPVYHQIYTYWYCDKCKKMVGQHFRFDELGLLTRFGDPFFEAEREA